VDPTRNHSRHPPPSLQRCWRRRTRFPSPPSGDVAIIGTTLQNFGESLFLESGSRVLDVACGSGNAALAASPVQWGSEPRLKELFQAARSLRAERRDFIFRYESVAHLIEVFRRFYGPTYKAFGALDEQGQLRLSKDREQLAGEYNRRSASFAVPGEYLEVVLER
jgi:hypothetical protein